MIFFTENQLRLDNLSKILYINSRIKLDVSSRSTSIVFVKGFVYGM